MSSFYQMADSPIGLVRRSPLTEPLSVINVAYWHQTDMTGLVGDVRSRGRTEVELLGRQVRCWTQSGHQALKINVPFRSALRPAISQTPTALVIRQWHCPFSIYLIACIKKNRQPPWQMLLLIHHRRITGISTVTESVALDRKGQSCPSLSGSFYLRRNHLLLQ
jgi:hypothetical protein